MIKYFTALILFWSCSSNTITNNDQHSLHRKDFHIKQADTIYTNYQKITFDIDSNNPDKIGFLSVIYKVNNYKEIWHFGVRSIFIEDYYVYLVDECHGNIKRIDLRTNEIKASNNLGNRDYFKNRLRTLAILNNKIYVFSSAFMNESSIKTK